MLRFNIDWLVVKIKQWIMKILLFVLCFIGLLVYLNRKYHNYSVILRLSWRKILFSFKFHILRRDLHCNKLYYNTFIWFICTFRQNYKFHYNFFSQKDNLMAIIYKQLINFCIYKQSQSWILYTVDIFQWEIYRFCKN